MNSLHPLAVDAHVAYEQERRFATTRPRRQERRRRSARGLLHEAGDVLTGRWLLRRRPATQERVHGRIVGA